MAQIEDRVVEIIKEAERKHNIHLTEKARRMLVIPILEAQDLENKVDFETVSNTMDILVGTLRKEFDPGDQKFFQNKNMRSAFSVVRSLFKNFCHIPPICGRG